MSASMQNADYPDDKILCQGRQIWNCLRGQQLQGVQTMPGPGLLSLQREALVDLGKSELHVFSVAFAGQAKLWV